MVPSTPRGASDMPRSQAAESGCGDDRFRDENRQPEMTEPARIMEPKRREPTFWLVPDTRDDIVVSRIGDF
jgi:hypothetical protein